MFPILISNNKKIEKQKCIEVKSYSILLRFDWNDSHVNLKQMKEKKKQIEEFNWIVSRVDWNDANVNPGQLKEKKQKWTR